MRKVQTAALTAASLLVFGGYYSLGDALDLLPGPVTVAYADVAPRPFPTPAGPSAKTAAPSGLDQGAPTPSKASLDGYVKGVNSDAALTGGNVTASVIDVATGEELLDRSAATGVTPASTNKLLTAWAALSSMGPGHTLQTKTVLEGQTLTLVGGGDVLLAENEGNPSATPATRAWATLPEPPPRSSSPRGRRRSPCAWTTPLFTGPQWNDKWEDGNQQYVAKVQPIMVDVSATQNQGYPDDPAMEAAQAFAKHLSEAGITLDGETTRAAASGGAKEVASVSSAPLSDVLSVSLKTSDNTMTEVEGRLVAVQAKETADFAGASKAVLAQLGKDGFDTSGVTLQDSVRAGQGQQGPSQAPGPDPRQGRRRRGWLGRTHPHRRSARRRPGRHPEQAPARHHRGRDGARQDRDAATDVLPGRCRHHRRRTPADLRGHGQRLLQRPQLGGGGRSCDRQPLRGASGLLRLLVRDAAAHPEDRRKARARGAW